MATQYPERFGSIKNFHMKAVEFIMPEICIFEPIGADPETGQGLTAKAFNASLKGLGSPSAITVRINSPGGDVMEAMAIYTMLKSFRAKITARVEGIAASAASLICMAADRIEIASNAFMLIHQPWATASGPADTLQSMADDLERMSDSYASIYAARSGQPLKAVVSLMNEDRLMTAEEAVSLGYADSVADFDAVSPNMSGLAKRHKATIQASRHRHSDGWAAAIALASRGKASMPFRTNPKADASWERAIAKVNAERGIAAGGDDHGWDAAIRKAFGGRR